jgi:hypothetical protein
MRAMFGRIIRLKIARTSHVDPRWRAIYARPP